MHYLKPDPSPKQKSNCGRFSKSGWTVTTASGLSYELGVNGSKKVNGNWDIINKNGHSTFRTGKHDSQRQNCHGC